MSTSPDIFLSYARDDEATARRFAERLEAQGFSVWWDAALRSGEAWDQEIEKALKSAKAVVVLWSTQSVESRWVRAEATLADRNKTLVPVMIEPCTRPIIFELTHTADLSHWKGDVSDKVWQGYVADVRRVVERGRLAPAGEPGETRPHRQQPAAATPWYRASRSVIAIPALVIAAAAILVYVLLRPLSPIAARVAPASAAAVTPASALAAPQSAAAGVSLAVLPFADMSPRHDQDYFADGLSEELLNQLAQIKDLKVAGRTSSFSFRGKNEDLRVIAEQLGVNHLLEGSVRKDGRQLRITAQLIDARDGTQLWSQTYDRELSSVFAIQEEIAKAVSRALSVALDVGENSRARGGTTNLDAYDKYLRALQLSSQFGTTQVMQAATLYREAVALDPGFSRAWLNLYQVLNLLRVYTPENSAALRTEATDVARHIEALAPGAWWTQAIRADDFGLQHRWTEAAAAATAMLAAGPASGVDVLTGYGTFLLSVGRAQEAVQYFRRARDAEPLSVSISVELQTSLDAAGLRDEMMAEAQRARRLAGDHATAESWNLVRIWSAKDANPSKVEALFKAHVRNTNVPMALHGELADKLTDKAAAVILIRKAFADPANQDTTRMYFILRYADHFGDRDLALQALHRMAELNFVSFYNLWVPYETHLRTDPRFNQILRKLKLAEYFRTSGNWGDFCRPLDKNDFECH